MTCDILIRSYYKDFEWLGYALRSVRRYCGGFSKLVLVVPRASRAKLDWLGLADDVTITCPDSRDDYLGQQVTKLTADLYSGADVICHLDSDCVFQRATTPGDLFENGKPRVLMARYSDLDPYVPWKELTEKFLGREVEFEFMRTPPYTFPRWIYGAFREFAIARHGKPLEQYILEQPARGFSEFNALGAYAYYEHRDRFTWVDIGAGAPPVEHCRVFWSWGGIDERIRGEIERLLRPAV